MAGPRPIVYATSTTCLGLVCLILACITVFLPIWGTYEDRHGGYQSERGYFGPWKVCKKINFNREICDSRVRFRVSGKQMTTNTICVTQETKEYFFVLFQVPFMQQEFWH